MESSILSEVHNTSILRTGLPVAPSLSYPPATRPPGSRPPRSGPERSDFVQWLVDEDFTNALLDDAQTLRKRLQLQEIVLVEATMLTGDHPARFKQAAEAASRHIAEDAPKPFEFALDVRRARKALIRPLDLGSPDSLPFGLKTKASTPTNSTT